MQFIDSGIAAMKADPPRKTNTRRVQKEGERLVYGHWTWRLVNREGQPLTRLQCPGVWVDKPNWVFCVATILDKHGHIKWQEGRRYASQPGRGKFGIGSFLCTTLRGEPLQDISWEDAIAEGIFRSGFGLAIGYANGVDGIVYASAVMAFECLWEIINDKPRMRWAENPPVFVIGMADFQWCDSEVTN